MELFPSNRVIGTVGLILGSEIGLKINSNRVPSARKRLQRVHCQGSREKKGKEICASSGVRDDSITIILGGVSLNR